MTDRNAAALVRSCEYAVEQRAAVEEVLEVDGAVPSEWGADEEDFHVRRARCVHKAAQTAEADDVPCP